MMVEITEKYYQSTDGRKFKDENECKEYEEALLNLEKIKSQRDSLNRDIARAEYILYWKDKYIKSTDYAGGCGHEGYYNKCPHCGELVGGYEGKNTSLKVDDSVYKCEKCGRFFRYA